MKPVFQHWRENVDKAPLLHSILKCADKINFEVNQDACAAFPSPCLYSETSKTTVGNSLKICISHIQSKESGSVPRTERASNTVEHPSPVTWLGEPGAHPTHLSSLTRGVWSRRAVFPAAASLSVILAPSPALSSLTISVWKKSDPSDNEKHI